MKKKTDGLLFSVYIFIIAFASTFLGYVFTSETTYVSVIWPIIGVSIAYYSMYRSRTIPYLFMGIFVGSVFSRLIIFSESIWIVLGISLLLSTIIILQTLFFKVAMEKTNSYGKINTKTIIAYLIILLFTAFIGASLSSVVLSLFYGFDIYFNTLGNWFIADLTGIIIFGTMTLSSFYFDEQNLKRRKTIIGMVFVLIFAFISFIIFSSYLGQNDYQKFYFVFIIMFFVAAFAFSYRMIFYISVVYILTYRLVYIGISINPDFSLVLLDLNLYLFTLTFLSMVVRLILYNIEEKNVSLLESNQKLEKLISSTNQLISIHEMRIQKKNSNAEYVRRIFRIAISLYNSYDLASCYIKVDNKPLFIDSQGYDIEMINSLDFSNDFHWALQQPEHIVTPENDLEKRLGNHYKEYNETVPELKESIRFGIYIDDENCGGMSFDIKKNSNKSFKKNDFENFKSFQKLMNSFYEINYLNTKNINLKNDMVLSLIKTLELYDHYTGGHSQEVAILSKKIAIKMGLSEQTIYDIYWAGIVHDIGKIGISYDILNSTERLTPEQYEQVKMHPVYGSKILYQSEDLFSIAEIVKHHHEWWNGNGYPDKLKGNEIPFGAQVLCVADAVSAMHGKRSYAPTKSSVEIIQELKAFSGKQFNTEIAKVMIELIEEGALETLKDEMI